MGRQPLTEEHHEWVRSISGVHPDSFSMVPPTVDENGVPLSIARPPEAPGAPKAHDAAEKPEVGLSFTFEFKVPTPKVKLVYAEAEGSVAYSVTCEPAEAADAETKVKFKNGEASIQSEISKKLTEKTKLVGGAEANGEKGSITAGLEIECTKQAKATIEFAFIELDAKKASVKFATLKWKSEYTLAPGTFAVGGLKIKYSGKLAVEIGFEPDWKELAEYAAKKLGLTVAEDAAVAGGTGTMGAAAIAVAPAAGIIGGIVGGVALCVGVCAAIGKLHDMGADCTAVCQEGERQLRAYADAYASTMRGQPGKNAQGNADAEAALQVIMKQNPGSTHEQAVQAAIDTKQNYGDLAFNRLKSEMIAKVTKEYKAKEGWVGWIFSYDTFNIVLRTILVDARY